MILVTGIDRLVAIPDGCCMNVKGIKLSAMSAAPQEKILRSFLKPTIFFPCFIRIHIIYSWQGDGISFSFRNINMHA